MRGFEIFKDEFGKQVYASTKIPEYSTSNAAGADFFCAEDVVVPSIWKAYSMLWDKTGVSDTWYGLEYAGSIKDFAKHFKPTLVHTGVCSFMDNDEVLEIYSRSSNPKKGLVLANSVGIIDADYRGEIMFAFYNFMPDDLVVKAGERIGQGIFKKFLRPDNCIVNDVERGTGGFGSTGK